MAQGAGGGRRPTPTRLKVVRGERKDRINDREPQPSAVEVEAPDWLSPDARKMWDRLAPDLIRKGVLTAWDIDAFGQLCEAYEGAVVARQRLDEEGEVVKNKRGGRVKNPWFQVWRDSLQVFESLAARFGLTPSDRSRVKAGDDKNEGKGKDPTRLLSGSQ